MRAGLAYLIGARKRVRGVRLVATDTDFDLGTGPVVEGPIQAILLAMGGRPAGIFELTGPGRSRLAEHL